ncbi:unnamed protein product [Dicrocoelium dendriticum]|nr:unnamed protein product [Dicrocoelium dendriticum]
MLTSLPELRGNPGPMTSSTPKKTCSALVELTNGSTMNGANYPDSPIVAESPHSRDHAMLPTQISDTTSVAPHSQSLDQNSTIHQRVNQNDEMTPVEVKYSLDEGMSETLSSIENTLANRGDTTTNTSYGTIKRHATNQNSILKQRLLAALATLIPHRETLSLRMLVTYTIDDKDSECLVIDETLCRQTSRLQTNSEGPSLGHSSDSGCQVDDSPPASKRPRTDSHPLVDTHVLDLSVHTERDEQELAEAMNTELDESADESSHTSPNRPSPDAERPTPNTHGKYLNAPGSIAKTSIPTGSINPLLISSSAVNGNDSTIFTASPFHPVDSSLLTLLPLLQQQLPQSNIRVFGQPKILSNIEPVASITTNSNTNSSNNASTNSAMPAETAESLLFRELQALIRSNNSMNRLVQEVPLDSSVPNVKASEAAGSYIASQAIPNLLSSPLNNSSLVGFPLFNAFSPDQLTAVQALLPSASLLNNVLSAPNITSLNLGSATLLNLRDKTTGQETLGIMQGANRHVTTPVTNLLNHISFPHATSISLKTLSTLSQLFTNSSEQSASKLSGSHAQLGSVSMTGEGRNIATEMFRVSEKRHNDISADPLAVTQSGELPPCTTISVAISQEGGNGKSSFVISDMRLPPSTPISILGGSNSPSDSITNGLSSSAYGSSQFMFGRRLAHTRRFTCNQCRKNFASLAELNRHTLEAHNSFKCTICSAHFTQRSNLQRHSLKHVGFKPFTCNLCRKEYYRKDHLVRHIEVTHPNHDPKMNITVHLTSSECLDYLDRLNAGKETPSPEGSVCQELGPDAEVSELESLKIDGAAGATNDGEEAELNSGGVPNPTTD